MRFRSIRYLEWARRHFDEAPPAYDLASSGMEPATMEQAGIDPARLRIAGSNSGGHPGFRQRVGELHGVSPMQVLPAAGTSGANFLIQAAILEEGDQVVCEWPAYEPLWRTMEALGARISWIERRPETAYTPDVRAIAEAFAQGARLCVLSDLHNPTAVLLPREVVQEIARLARRFDAWLLMDEVYLAGVFDHPVESAARFGERVIVTSSLTKCHGLGGLRAGWAIAPPEIVERASSILTHLIGNASIIADEAACQAMEHLPPLLARARERRAENWPVVRAFAEEQGLLECDSAGAFIAWFKLPPGVQADRFVEHLHAKYDTLVVPGSFFGMDDHIRLGFSGRPEKVREGLARVGRALDDVRGARPH